MKNLAGHTAIIIALASLFGCLLLGIITWTGKKALIKLDSHSETLAAMRVSLEDGNRRFKESDARFKEGDARVQVIRDKVHDIAEKVTSNDVRLRVMERNETTNM